MFTFLLTPRASNVPHTLLQNFKDFTAGSGGPPSTEGILEFLKLKRDSKPAYGTSLKNFGLTSLSKTLSKLSIQKNVFQFSISLHVLIQSNFTQLLSIFTVITKTLLLSCPTSKSVLTFLLLKKSLKNINFCCSLIINTSENRPGVLPRWLL